MTARQLRYRFRIAVWALVLRIAALVLRIARARHDNAVADLSWFESGRRS